MGGKIFVFVRCFSLLFFLGGGGGKMLFLGGRRVGKTLPYGRVFFQGTPQNCACPFGCPVLSNKENPFQTRRIANDTPLRLTGSDICVRVSILGLR